MSVQAGMRVDWRALWASGDLFRFCFVSLGILLHATNETMIATIMPAMVGDLSGVELVGWSLAVYELGAISAGAAAGRLVSYVPLRTNMVVAALLYAAGALICAAAPSMPIFLLGRLIEGLGGGALVSLAFVSVERLFQRAIWPQLFAVMSAIWGVAAFSGPLFGALVAESLSWRWAFGLFSIAGFAMAAASFLVLTGSAATSTGAATAPPPPFPLIRSVCLALAVTLIASAGVSIELVRSSVLLVLGLVGLACSSGSTHDWPAARLFPSRLFDWRSKVGSGMTMVAAFSVATCSFAVYGPLILTSLHGIPVLTTGYIIAAESIAWSILSILVANAPPRRERADHRRRRADDRGRHRRLRLCGAGWLDPADPCLRGAARRRLRHRLAVRYPRDRRGRTGRRAHHRLIGCADHAAHRLCGRRRDDADRRQCQRLLGRPERRHRRERRQMAVPRLRPARHPGLPGGDQERARYEPWRKVRREGRP